LLQRPAVIHAESEPTGSSSSNEGLETLAGGGGVTTEKAEGRKGGREGMNVNGGEMTNTK
jgi:hypothetical protein